MPNTVMTIPKGIPIYPGRKNGPVVFGKSRWSSLIPLPSAAEKRQTLRNAEKASDKAFYQYKNPNLKSRKNVVLEALKYPLTVSLALAACLFGVRGPIVNQYTRFETRNQVAQHDLSAYMQEREETGKLDGVLFQSLKEEIRETEQWMTMLSGLTLFSTLGAGAAGAVSLLRLNDINRFKKAYQRAQQFDDTLQVVKAKTPEKQRLVEFLISEGEAHSAHLAQLFHNETDPEIQKLDRMLFTNEQGEVELPTPKSVAKLFHYYTYLLVRAERIQRRQPVDQLEIDEETYMQKLLTLLRIGRYNGELFEFTETSSDAPPFQEVFRPELLNKVSTVEREVQDRIEVVKVIFQQKDEVDTYLNAAQQLRAAHRRSEMPRSEEQTQKLNSIIESYKAQQEEIERQLEKVKKGMNSLDSLTMLDIQTNQLSLLSMLEVLQQTHENDPWFENLLEQYPNIRRDLQRRYRMDWREAARAVSAEEPSEEQDIEIQQAASSQKQRRNVRGQSGQD